MCAPPQMKIFGPGRDEVTGLEDTAYREASRYVLHTKFYYGDHIKKNDMGGAYGTCGGEERCIQGSDGET